MLLKATSNSTGHPANSSPLAEQQFLVSTINALMQLPQWNSVAIMIRYDDSDGWYDYVMPPIVNQSNDPAQDTLAGKAMCGTLAAGGSIVRRAGRQSAGSVQLCGGTESPERVSEPDRGSD
jgi:phospholipase C